MKLPVLYSKTSKGKLHSWTIEVKGNVVWTEWGEVGGCENGDHYFAEGKNIGRSNETTPEEQANLEATSKWESKKLKKYYETADAAMNTLNIKPMRAYTLDDKREAKLKWPVDVQPKFDGVRCMAYLRDDGTVRLMSRGGKDYTVPLVAGALTGRLAAGMCLDGELYVHGESLQEIRHLIANKDPSVTFHVYDCTELPTNDHGWEKRKAILDMWFATASNLNDDVIVQSVVVSCADIKAVKRTHDKYVKDGYEGAMIRTMTGKYKLAGKSTDLLKYKMFVDDEFVIVRVGKGKDEVPLYTCIQEEGLEFDVRPVGTAEQRKRLLREGSKRVGQLLTVKYQNRSDDNIPLFPVGKSFRPAADLD